MNERIEKLAKQAMIFSYENGGWLISTHVPEDFKEKFAELIVKEFLEQIYSVTIDNPTDDWDQGYNSGLYQAAETIYELTQDENQKHKR